MILDLSSLFGTKSKIIGRKEPGQRRRGEETVRLANGTLEQGVGEGAPGGSDPRVVRAQQVEVLDEPLADGVPVISAHPADKAKQPAQRTVDIAARERIVRGGKLSRHV